MILAFDFGLRRIGVAVGQLVTHSATPLAALQAEKGRPNWEEIAALIKKWHPEILLVGLPYKLDGGEQAISFAARQFGHELATRFHLPIELIDERLTTREAKLQLAESGIKFKDFPSIDSYAAKLILESWMNEHKSS